MADELENGPGPAPEIEPAAPDVPAHAPVDPVIEPALEPEIAPDVPTEPAAPAAEPTVPDPAIEPVVEPVTDPVIHAAEPAPTVLTPEVAEAIAAAIPDPVMPADPAVAVVESVAEALKEHPEREDMGKVYEQNGKKYVRTTDVQGNVVDIALPSTPTPPAK